MALLLRMIAYSGIREGITSDEKSGRVVYSLQMQYINGRSTDRPCVQTRYNRRRVSEVRMARRILCGLRHPGAPPRDITLRRKILVLA